MGGHRARRSACVGENNGADLLAICPVDPVPHGGQRRKLMDPREDYCFGLAHGAYTHAWNQVFPCAIVGVFDFEVTNVR